MNNTPIVKYKSEPEHVEKKVIGIGIIWNKFDFYRVDKVKKNNERLKRHGEKADQRKKLNVRENLNVGEDFSALAGRIKEKDLHRKFCKCFIENQLYFNKNENFEDDE